MTETTKREKTKVPNIYKRASKGGVRYQVVIRVKGQKPTSATFPTMKEAKGWLKDNEKDVRQGKYWRHSPAYQHTMSDLFTKYKKWPKFTAKKSASIQEAQVDYFDDRIGDKLIGDVDPALIAGLRDELAAPNEDGKQRTGATVNRYLALLSHVFTYASQELGWVEQNPLRRVAKLQDAEKRVRYLSKDERSALLDACKAIDAEPKADSRLYLIAVFALSTGARKGEILKLEWKHVDLKAGTAALVDTKNGETRSVPLTGHLLDLMKAYKKNRVVHINSDLVFPSKPDPEKPWDFRSAWRKAVKKAKLVNFKFHDCRHDFASNCLANGATLPQLMHLMGHKSPQMVSRYAHMAKDHQSDLVANMTAKLFAGVK